MHDTKFAFYPFESIEGFILFLLKIGHVQISVRIVKHKTYYRIPLRAVMILKRKKMDRTAVSGIKSSSINCSVRVPNTMYLIPSFKVI